MIGETISPYRVIEIVVYKAEDTRLPDKVGRQLP
jgi:hypothetical protein